MRKFLVDLVGRSFKSIVVEVEDNENFRDAEEIAEELVERKKLDFGYPKFDENGYATRLEAVEEIKDDRPADYSRADLAPKKFVIGYSIEKCGQVALEAKNDREAVNLFHELVAQDKFIMETTNYLWKEVYNVDGVEDFDKLHEIEKSNVCMDKVFSDDDLDPNQERIFTRKAGE